MLLSRLAAVVAVLVTARASSHDKLRAKRSHKDLVKEEKRHVGPPAGAEVFQGRAGTNETLVKRDSYTGQGTFFYVGLGACGQTSQDSDLMVALNTPQYGGGYPGPNCFKWITVQANGVTVSGIQILDECPTCGWGSLDMSPGLFQHFADESVGVLDITWWYDDGSSSGGGNASPSPSPTTQAWSPSPTPQWTPPSTTSTKGWTAPSAWWNQNNDKSTPSSSAWEAPSSSSTTTTTSTTSTTTTSSTTTTTYTTSSSSSTTTSAATTTSVNPFVEVQSTPPPPSSSAAEEPVEMQATANNLEAINGLVTAYGQVIIVGAGGSPATS